MPRGFVWALYQTDLGFTFALKVDADSANDPNRGWTTQGVAGVPPLSRGWLPRRVVGIDDTGVLRSARVASTDAPLWTGVATSFQFEGSDQQTHTAEVIATVQERPLLGKEPS